MLNCFPETMTQILLQVASIKHFVTVKSQSHRCNEGFSQHQRQHRVEGWPAAMIESYPSGARNQITSSICKSVALVMVCYHSIRKAAITLTTIPPCGHLVYPLIHQQTLG